jgi:hypothetical protein
LELLNQSCLRRKNILLIFRSFSAFNFWNCWTNRVWEEKNIIDILFVFGLLLLELLNQSCLRRKKILFTSWATGLCSGFVLSALSLCLFVSMFLYLSVPLSLPSISLSLPNLTLNMPACWPARPSLFSDKKFPVVEAHFWLDELLYYIDILFVFSR